MLLSQLCIVLILDQFETCRSVSIVLVLQSLILDLFRFMDSLSLFEIVHLQVFQLLHELDFCARSRHLWSLHFLDLLPQRHIVAPLAQFLLISLRVPRHEINLILRLVLSQILRLLLALLLALAEHERVVALSLHLVHLFGLRFKTPLIWFDFLHHWRPVQVQLIDFTLFPLLLLLLLFELLHGAAEVTLHALLQILVPSLG